MFGYAIMLIALERQMSQILVRNLDPGVVDRLKRKAKLRGRSLQTEVKEILVQAATDVETDRKKFFHRLELFQKGLKKGRFSDSAELIREDRDR